MRISRATRPCTLHLKVYETPAAPMLTLFTLLTEAIGEQGLKPTGERPPAKAGGFGLRLEAGSIGHSAD